MKFIFILFSFLSVALNSKNVFAQTVLVPDSSVSLDQYTAKCAGEGYICTQEFFFE